MREKQELIALRNTYVRQLKQKSERLSAVNSRLLSYLEEGNLQAINGLGEIQSLGYDIDVLCGKISVLDSICENRF